MATKKKRKRKPQTEFDRAIAAVTSREARIDHAIDELITAATRLRHASRQIEETARELTRHTVLDREVEAAINKLKATFRDGPIQINASLVRLAQDILQDQIRSVLADQMNRLTRELALIAREEVAAEVSAALRELELPNVRPVDGDPDGPAG